MCVGLLLQREIYFKDLVHETIETGSRDRRAEMKSTQSINSTELDLLPVPAWCAVFTSIPRRLSDS